MSELKRVSFEVAKALKEAGYPQEATEGIVSQSRYDRESRSFILIPFIIEVWSWLWQEKDIKIVVGPNCLCIWFGLKYVNLDSKHTNDPEEAIIAAIQYLVDNDLIK